MPVRPPQPDASSGVVRAWHGYEDPTGDAPVTREIAAAMTRDNPTRATLEIRLADFRALVREAESGELRSDRWKPVTRDPLLWEIRCSWELPDAEEDQRATDSAQIRGYFLEPDRAPSQTVLLAVHEKDLTPAAPHLVNRAQDRHIDRASARAAVGGQHLWGLEESLPLFPRA